MRSLRRARPVSAEHERNEAWRLSAVRATNTSEPVKKLSDAPEMVPMSWAVPIRTIRAGSRNQTTIERVASSGRSTIRRGTVFIRPKILAGAHTSAKSRAEINSNSVVAAAAHWTKHRTAYSICHESGAAPVVAVKKVTVYDRGGVAESAPVGEARARNERGRRRLHPGNGLRGKQLDAVESAAVDHHAQIAGHLPRRSVQTSRRPEDGVVVVRLAYPVRLVALSHQRRRAGPA